MKGYPEYYTIVYRDDQRVMILEDNPKARNKVAPPKRGGSKVYQTKERLSFGNQKDRSTLPHNAGLSKFWFPK